MADLTFATKGQAEALAAQESIRKKALDTRQEFEAGAKAAGAWDASIAKLKSGAETALRSIQTEQEKIVDRINRIKEAQEKGLVPPAEAEESIRRLKQQWIDVDGATQRAKKASDDFADAQKQVAEKAHDALDSVRTESERVEKKIRDIEVAMQSGLIPPEEATEGIAKLKEKLGETADHGGKLEHILKHAFDPTLIVKYAASFVGVHAAIHLLQEEVQDFQEGVDERIKQGLKPKEKLDKLDADIKSKQEDVARQQEQAADRKRRADEANARYGQSEKDRVAGVDQQIEDAELDLARAREDKQSAAGRESQSERQQRESRDEQIRQARLSLARAEEDRGRAKTEDSQRGADRRIEDAKSRLANLNRPGDEGEASTAVRGADRRIADLQEQLHRLQAERAKPGDADSRDEASRSAREAQQDFAKSQQRLKELEKERADLDNSPAGRKYDYLKKRDDALDDAYGRMAAIHPVEEPLSTEELEKRRKVLREAGTQGRFWRWAQEWADWATGEGVSDAETAEQYRQAARDVRGYTQQDGPMGDVVPRPESDLTPAEREQIRILNEMAVHLEEIARQAREGGIPITAE